jgi:hypothetical protein
MIREEFAKAVRPVFFQTEHEEWLYATHAGTPFLVTFNWCVNGVTCGHVFSDFPHGQLFVTQEKHAQKGRMPAHVTGLAYPSSPRDHAVGTDVTDLRVIQFSDVNIRRPSSSQNQFEHSGREALRPATTSRSAVYARIPTAVHKPSRQW